MKRLEGRDEIILDPDLPIVDAHHHLVQRPTLRYLLDEYLEDAMAGHHIVGSVYVETLAMARKDGPELLRPLGEVEFANGIGAMAASGVYGDCLVCAGIVGYADLRYGSQVAELLERSVQVAPDRFRGIRQVTIEHPTELPFKYISNRPPVGAMTHPQFKDGFAQLARFDLTFDAAVFHHQLDDVGQLAATFPMTTIVLNHAGSVMAMGMSVIERAEIFKNWESAMRRLAEHPNVVVKVGGFGLPFWDFGLIERTDSIGYLELAQTWAPYVEVSVEAFGTNRCMMEGNYPWDGRSCGFVPMWNALKYITRHYTPEERADLFHRTASRVYRLHIPALAHL
jgi:predicted TIM-barrel fold metal-dependent hydrolase